MNRVVVLLSKAVRNAPVVVLVSAILLTAVLGSFASQVVQGGGNEGFSPRQPRTAGPAAHRRGVRLGR